MILCTACSALTLHSFLMRVVKSSNIKRCLHKNISFLWHFKLSHIFVYKKIHSAIVPKENSLNSSHNHCCQRRLLRDRGSGHAPAGWRRVSGCRSCGVHPCPGRSGHQPVPVMLADTFPRHVCVCVCAKMTRNSI